MIIRRAIVPATITMDMEMELRLPLESPAARTPNRFEEVMESHGVAKLRRNSARTLQINVGKLCNQACQHCHVEASPKRTEIMDESVVSRVLELAAHPQVQTVDLTGGAPEMNPSFRRLVETVAGMGKEIIVRCNLTIVEEAGYAWLPEFYAEHRVHLICSLPCYSAENVVKQRGKGVFEKSIAAMRKLNTVGYARRDHPAGLRLDLVYNPVGEFLPPQQAALEEDYRRELGSGFGVTFSSLLTLANMPIGRYKAALDRGNSYEPYMALLSGAFNAGTVPHLMCRDTLSVSWDGKIYDCDFNQMLGMQVNGGESSIFDPQFDLAKLGGGAIATADHCLGCTAGAGSSCGGALTG